MVNFLQAIFITGVISVLAQTLLMRELVTVFYGNELIIGFMASVWLFWGGMGSLTMEKLCRQKLVTPLQFAFAQMTVALILPLELIFIRGIKSILAIPPGELTDPLTILLASFLILLPLSFINGFQFTLGARIYTDTQSKPTPGIGPIYGLDALGDMIGGALFAYFFVYYFSPLKTIIICSLIHLFSALIIFSSTKKVRFVIIDLILIVIVFLSAFALPIKNLELKTRRWDWKKLDLIETGSSIYGEISLVQYGSIYNLYENGLLSFSTPVRIQAEEMIHLTMPQVRSPQRVLIIGGAVAGALNEILKYPVKKVYYIEPDALVIKLISPYLTSEDRQALFDPRVTVINQDGRLFIKNWRGEKFDVVIVNLSDPVNTFLNRFYTLEFYQEVSRIINDRGVIRIAISSKETYLSKEMLDYNGSIYHTLKREFPDILLIPGDRLTIIATRRPDYLTLDPEVIDRRLRDLDVKTNFINKYYLKGIILEERINYLRNKLEGYNQVTINRDYRPISYYYGLSYWATYFRTVVIKGLKLISRINIVGFIAMFAIIFFVILILKNRAQNTLLLTTGVVGFNGMAGVIIGVILYQTIFGYVYHRVGLLTATFMLGIFIGTIGQRLLSGDVITRYKWYIFFFCLYYLTGLIFLKLLIKINPPVLVKDLFPIITFIPGLIVGASFSTANLILARNNADKPIRTGRLYTFDLLGGSLGGISISLLLIPIYGIPNTLLTLLIINFICLLFTLILLNNHQ